MFVLVGLNMIPVSRLKKTVSVNLSSVMLSFASFVFQLSKVNMSAMEEVEVCDSSCTCHSNSL